VLRLVLAMTWFWRRRIARFEVVARDQAERLIAGGIPSERIILARDRAPVTIRAGAHRAPRPPGTEGRSLLLYSGNWGLAHDAETVLAAYRRHHRCGTGRTLLWLNASGQRAIRLRAALREEALPFVDGALVPLDRLASLLMAADAHLVTLAPGFEGLVLPSKVYACIETRRPILFVGAARSDVHALCLERDVPHYRRVDPGDVLALEAALTAIADVRARDLSAAQEPLHRAAVRAPAPRPRTMSALASHAAADAHAAE
jgi:hypothetical protein